ncbi:UPF0225 protein [Angustibacter aerolatus]|uniref:UPF0225 protein GCM10025868_24220 n=1 Tax=Angustibacter aerolatus TaxID=1162965 RepID=A0ABQ6JHF5_9ACTN|nr:YchJ family metal-binding protein [Angustibacter aerolatus]GMA87172.1 UPF0225 protein [Angustibacter aerolatus]
MTTTDPRDPAARCPCGSGETYGACCGRLHDGTTHAGTAEQAMRSRYSAFAVGDTAYLLATWHPSTRPATLELDTGTRWRFLEIVSTSGGGLLDTDGVVEFRAHHVHDRARGVQHEVSRFTRVDGRWSYVDGRTG